MTNKMNPEIKAKWVEALRSGRYEQCESKLWDGYGGFCCLGVLSDIKRKESKASRERFFEKQNRDAEDAEFLSPAVMAWAGLVTPDPVIGCDSGEELRATHANDEANYSFNEIADLIEKNL